MYSLDLRYETPHKANQCFDCFTGGDFHQHFQFPTFNNSTGCVESIVFDSTTEKLTRTPANENFPNGVKLINTTGICCTPVYHEQSVEATVDVKTHATITLKRFGTITPILMTLFNTTLLHFTLSVGS
jgi:hypothetical protein